MFIYVLKTDIKMLYYRLYNEGHQVVGVEGVEQVIQEFGLENNITFQVSELPWAKHYKVILQ